MPTSYEFRTAWLLHILSPVMIAVCASGVTAYHALTGGAFPGWIGVVAFAAVTAFILLSLRRTLIRSARLTDDTVEVDTWAGTRRIPLADVERPGRLTRSSFMGTNVRMVNVDGGSFAVPGYSRRAAAFLEDLATRVRA